MLTIQQPTWTLSISLQLTDTKLSLSISSLPPSIARLHAIDHLLAYTDILTTILTTPTTTISRAISLGPNELSQLWTWNRAVPPTIDTCIHEYFSANARAYPDRPAVVSWDGEMSYGVVEEYSTRLAKHITSRGVDVGKAVMLCFEKSMWTVVAVLAVMKAGGALVLTDPSQPEARLTTIAEESKACLVLTSRKQAELAAKVAPGVEVLPIEPGLFSPGTLDTSASLPLVPPSTTLYIIFTSGSTGKPKGVVISHRNYTSGAIPRAEAVGYTSHSRVLDFPSYAFDVSIDCMLCTLAQGGCICVPSEEDRINNLSGAIRSMSVNMAHMTPSVARVLEPDILPQLEVLGLGGESVSASDASEWGKHTKIIIAYGPSECTVGCTINNEIIPGRTYMSIGHGVGGSTWIVDPTDHNRLMPVGAVGELLIEGPIVGVGYLNEPEKTAEVFVEDPAWLLAGGGKASGRPGRLYKTGDLVRYDPDGSGSIVFIGRADAQVKLRGQRVELGEIEHHLRNHLPPGTHVAAEVITPGGKKGEATLVAFVAEEKKDSTTKDGELITSFSPELTAALETMDDAIGTVLPRYMVPAAYIPLREMPLLVSLKTDRKQLRALGSSLTRQKLASLKLHSGKKTKPTTELEIRLHALWTQLFGADTEIGTRDNFFDMGGDSLRAMRLVAAARGEGFSLTVADIFRFPRLADMALTMTKISESDAENHIPELSLVTADWQDSARSEVAKLCGLPESSIEDVYPCTPLQEGLMALSAKVAEAYVAQRVVKLPSHEVATKMKSAFDTAVADTPILRTRIVQVPRRGLMQVVVKEGIAWGFGEDLEAFLETDRDDAMGLGTRLARFAVINDKKTASPHFVLTIHHALYDGWSMPLVVDRVNRAYRGLSTQRAEFKAFIKYLNSLDRKSSESYWRSYLQGASGLQFPVLPYSGYQAQAESLLEHYVTLSRTVSASSTSIATAIRGAWAIVAARYCGADDVVFGETLTGRNAPVPGVEQLEGPMITTVPVRIRINKKERVSDYLRNVHNQTVTRIAHEHMGLQHIRRLSPDAREACELRTGLVIHPTTDEGELNGASEDEPANGFVPAGDAEAAREALKFNSYSLMLVFTVDTKGFLIMASFDSKTVDVPQMQSVLEQLGETVQFLCEQTTANLGDVPVDTDTKEQWKLSSVGVESLTSLPKDVPENLCKDATATWLVHPSNRERLVPVGGVGELLIECSSTSCCEAFDTPTWLSAGCAEFPGRNAKICTTGQLAKYTTDGKIIFLGRRDERIDQSRVQEEPDQARVPASVDAKRLEKLKELWCRVLGLEVEEIGPNDSFFDLGGDSIGAMKLVSEARMEELQLTVAKVFRHRRLADMAQVVETLAPQVETAVTKYTPFAALSVSNVDALISAIRPALADPSWKITDVLPARPLQEIATKGTVHLPRYSARYELFYLDAAVDKARLFECCQELVARNEILRTVFVENEGQYYGAVLEELKVPIAEYEIDGDVEAFSKTVTQVDVQEHMPLGASFVKFLFVQGTNGHSCLLFRISHAQYDEMCLPIMLRQLSALYEGTTVPETQPFSPYVNHLIKESIPQSIQYWRDLLRGSSMSVIRPRTAVKSKTPAAISRTIDISSRSKEITIATLPTAAWALTLARHLKTSDVVFGEVVSGRNTGFPNCDIVTGPCWQYVPFRVKFEPDWTGLDLLNFVQDQHIASARFEGIGLKEVVEHCTDWDKSVDWFDTVVHQAVAAVESLPFLSANSRMETIYPHLEPLREWKIQAFIDGEKLVMEVVTFEEWMDEAKTLLDGIERIMKMLVSEPQTLLAKMAVAEEKKAKEKMDEVREANSKSCCFM